MHARKEPPPPDRRLAPRRGNLAPPPGLDLRPGQQPNQCVNQFQSLFLSELVLHYNVLGLANCQQFTINWKVFILKKGYVNFPINGKLCWDCDNSGNKCTIKNLQLFERIGKKDQAVSDGGQISIDLGAISVQPPSLEYEVQSASAQAVHIDCSQWPGSTGLRSTETVEVRLVQGGGISLGHVGVDLKKHVLAKTTVTPQCTCCCWAAKK